MSNPLTHAFFLGRAVAEALQDQLEKTLTDVLSEVGKFDAEQREHLRQFTEQVQERARQAEAAAVQTRPTVSSPDRIQSNDLQAMIDDLRAEIARLRAELKSHRDRA
jgi:uncharacterized coiled-coil protein SlyX